MMTRNLLQGNFEPLRDSADMDPSDRDSQVDDILALPFHQPRHKSRRHANPEPETDLFTSYDRTEAQKRERRSVLANYNILSRPYASNCRPSFDWGNSELPTTNPLAIPVVDDPEKLMINRYGKGKDPKDIETNRRAKLTYRQRCSEDRDPDIVLHIVSMIHRKQFVEVFANAVLTFGAPSHRFESQLVYLANRKLKLNAEFICLPGVIVMSLVDDETHTSETHTIKRGGGLQLGRLLQVQSIYKDVVKDRISAKTGTVMLEKLLNSPAIYNDWVRCTLLFVMSALICPLSFGGSFVDAWVAGAGAFVLRFVQLRISSKNSVCANVYEIIVAILLSFVAQALSTAKPQVFCYTAISSSGVIGILPGYLIRVSFIALSIYCASPLTSFPTVTSSLELGSKNLMSGSVRMVYALIYTLFLGFGLQIGSDIYYLFDSTAFHEMKAMAANQTVSILMNGYFTADNNTQTVLPMSTTFTWTNLMSAKQENIVMGCLRPPSDPWYLQSAPFWAQFVIVPIFSLLSSLANLQPIHDHYSRVNLFVMVIISCVSFATNKIANHYIFNHSDVVSAIGAFTIGVLGNVWSRATGRSSFTSMVTGILFLVPSGLSQAGGITTSNNGIAVGTSMIHVSVGITVGLFMSQALISLFGTSNIGLAFSF